MRGWLTLDSVPSTRTDYVLTLPSSEEWRAQFLGAFLLLALSENWQEFGTLTPDQMADEWLELLLLFESEGTPVIPTGTIMAYAGSTPPAGFFMCDFSEFNRADFSGLFDIIGTRYGVGNGTTTANLPDLRGRVVVGFDATDADFNDLENFGGQKGVTLEVSELPSHNHTQDSHNHTQDSHNHTQNSHNHTQNSHNHTQDSHNHTQNAHSHTVDGLVNALAGTARRTLSVVNTGDSNVVTRDATATNIAATATNQATTPTNQSTTATNQSTTPTNQSATATNQATGGDVAHNNLQPYWVMNYIIKY